jgi:hypothetical protein
MLMGQEIRVQTRLEIAGKFQARLPVFICVTKNTLQRLRTTILSSHKYQPNL